LAISLIKEVRKVKAKSLIFCLLPISLTLFGCQGAVRFSPPVVSTSIKSLDWERESDHLIIRNSGIWVDLQMEALGYDSQEEKIELLLTYRLGGQKPEEYLFTLSPDPFYLALYASGSLVCESNMSHRPIYKADTQFSVKESVPLKSGEYELVASLLLILSRPDLERAIETTVQTPTMEVTIP